MSVVSSVCVVWIIHRVFLDLLHRRYAVAFQKIS